MTLSGFDRQPGVGGEPAVVSMSEYQEQDSASGATAYGGSEAGKDRGRPVRVVRYGAMAWVGEFSQKSGLVYACGSRVVVQTERGIELGEPVGAPCEDCGCELLVPRGPLQTYVKNSGPDFCRPRAGRILRVANQQDINEQNHLNANIRDDITHCAALTAQLGLDMKIITAEHLLGGERIVFYFSSPSRVDFRQLVKELAQRYRTRIEMRQVGARDEARLVADYEVCGRECCCRNFLKKLRPVNMKMAKLQKSTLDPSKVSGRCGRLRCCLRYEHFGYEELANRLPRVGSRVGTDDGTGTVVDRQVLTQLVLLRADDGRMFTVTVEEIRAFDLPPPPPKAPEPAAPVPASATGAEGAQSERDRQARRRGRGRRGPDAERPGQPRPESPVPSRGFQADVEDAEPGAGSTPQPDVVPVGSPPPEPNAGPDAGAPREPAAGPPGEAVVGKPEGQHRRRRRGRRRRPGTGGSPPPAGGGGNT